MESIFYQPHLANKSILILKNDSGKILLCPHIQEGKKLRSKYKNEAATLYLPLQLPRKRDLPPQPKSEIKLDDSLLEEMCASRSKSAKAF